MASDDTVSGTLPQKDAPKSRCVTETQDGRCMYYAGHAGNCVISPNRDFTSRSIHRRHLEMQREWQQILRDVDHWNRTHPDEEPIKIEPITMEEIEALKHARK